MKNISSARFLTLSAIVLIAAVTRLIPHAPNFTPIAAIALFGGANFNSRWQAFLVPFAAMLLSDFIIGFHSNMFAVYLSFALIVLIGMFIRNNQSAGSVVTGAVSSSLLFFLITNFSVWVGNIMYPQSFAGLIDCYIAAIPFYKNSLLGDLFYSAVLFGGFYLARVKFPVLAK